MSTKQQRSEKCPTVVQRLSNCIAGSKSAQSTGGLAWFPDPLLLTSTIAHNGIAGGLVQSKQAWKITQTATVFLISCPWGDRATNVSNLGGSAAPFSTRSDAYAPSIHKAHTRVLGGKAEEQRDWSCTPLELTVQPAYQCIPVIYTVHSLR